MSHFFFSFYKCFPNFYFLPVLISSIFSHACYFLRLFPFLSCVYPLCKTPCNWVKLYFNERKCWSIQVKPQISLCNPCEDVILWDANLALSYQYICNSAVWPQEGDGTVESLGEWHHRWVNPRHQKRWPGSFVSWMCEPVFCICGGGKSADGSQRRGSFVRQVRRVQCVKQETSRKIRLINRIHRVLLPSVCFHWPVEWNSLKTC